MEMTEYPPGWPSWVDLQTDDVGAAAAFYGGLFGWELGPEVSERAGGGYRMFRLRGRNVAGVSPASPGDALVWSTYVSVDDADVTMRRALERGALPLLEPTDVMDAGRIGVFLDPSGARLGIWQPGTQIGAELCNEPSTFCWNELNARDPDTGVGFYPRVFNWEVRRSKGDMQYYEFHIDGHTVAGMQPMLAPRWRGVAPHWQVYFAVADAEAAVTTVSAGGGSVDVGVTDIPGVGRFASLRDPRGAAFCVLEIRTPRP